MTEEATTRGSLWQNFFRKQAAEDSSIKGILSRVAIFSGLTGKELSKMSLIVHRRQYDVDEPIFAQGDPGLGMYVIEEGKVDIVYKDGTGIDKRLASLKPGDFFGELSLLDESPRSATAVAKTPLKIIGFFRPDLLGLLDRSPKLGTKILLRLGEVIGTRLRVANEQLGKLGAELKSKEENEGGEGNVNS